MMPVHPVLAAMLAEWKLTGWALLMGRQPTPDDLIVPMPPDHAARRRTRNDQEGMRRASYSRDRFKEDLALLGFRHRRGHDLRRTMISLAMGGWRTRRHSKALHPHREGAPEHRHLHVVALGGTVCGGGEAQDPATA